MLNIDELKILLTLNGQQRLPHLESEIFASRDLYTCYLDALCKDYDWYENYSNYGIGCIAYRYSKSVIKGRWPEAEKVIATSPQFAYCYAKYVIKGRWPAAEPIIMKDANAAYLYAAHVIKDRWPEAETSIAKDRTSKLWYNEDFGTNI
jgi:hypothetical protein